MKMIYKHIFFEEAEGLIRGKKWFHCKNNKTKALLGNVFYYSRWRKYVFCSEESSVYDVNCLKDVISFMEQL